MDWKHVFLSPNGRIGQGQYWLGILILVIAWVLSHLFHIFAPLIWLLLIYPWVCVIAKRLHDFGKSGFFILLPFLVGAVLVTAAVMFGGLGAFGAIMTMLTQGTEPASWTAFFAGLGIMLACLALAGIVKLIFLLWVGLAPGDPGPNAYGPPMTVSTTPPVV